VPPTFSPEELDGVLTALGNAKRREILLSLALRPSTVGQLAKEHGLSLPSIHRHVRDLEQSGLVLRKKVGRTNFIAFRRAGMLEVQAWLQQFNAYWGNDEETLENYISENAS